MQSQECCSFCGGTIRLLIFQRRNFYLTTMFPVNYTAPSFRFWKNANWTIDSASKLELDRKIQDKGRDIKAPGTFEQRFYLQNLSLS